MFLGSLFFLVIGVLYLVFAFREPPEVIAHLFPIPIVAVFFPPERRVKFGRITIGVLLLLAGPLCWLLPQGGLLGGSSVLGVIVGLVILGVWVAAKWKRAGEVVEADDAERRAQWQSFELLKRDPRFLHLQQNLYAKGYRTTFERSVDAMAYRVIYIDLWDAKLQSVLAQHGTAACQIVAYLERDAAPKRIQASLDLQTGVCGEMVVGLMGWGGRVPLQPVSA